MRIIYLTLNKMLPYSEYMTSHMSPMRFHTLLSFPTWFQSFPLIQMISRPFSYAAFNFTENNGLQKVTKSSQSQYPYLIHRLYDTFPSSMSYYSCNMTYVTRSSKCYYCCNMTYVTISSMCYYCCIMTYVTISSMCYYCCNMTYVTRSSMCYYCCNMTYVTRSSMCYY